MNGRKVLQIAARRVGDEYLLGVMVPKDNSNWSGPWDCAEFASWCVYQAAGILYGCENNRADPSIADAYTGYWQRDARRLGQKVSVELAAQTPGALVLRYPQPGLIGHIAISDGRGGTVEAHSRRTGVVEKLISGRRWDTGVLVPGIEYTQRNRPVPVESPVVVFRLTTPLMSGRKAREIQSKLKEKGFNPGRLDGVYGPKTAAAVAAFQIANGLVADGETGIETATALGVELP